MPPAGRAGPRTASPLPTHAPGLPELPPQLLTGHCVPRHAVRTATQGRAPRLEPLLGSVPLTRRSPRPGRRIWLSHFISAVGLPVLSGLGGSEKPPAAPARLWPPQHADEPAAKRTSRPLRPASGSELRECPGFELAGGTARRSPAWGGQTRGQHHAGPSVPSPGRGPSVLTVPSRTHASSPTTSVSSASTFNIPARAYRPA